MNWILLDWKENSKIYLLDASPRSSVQCPLSWNLLHCKIAFISLEWEICALGNNCQMLNFGADSWWVLFHTYYANFVNYLLLLKLDCEDYSSGNFPVWSVNLMQSVLSFSKTLQILGCSQGLYGMISSGGQSVFISRT